MDAQDDEDAGSPTAGTKRADLPKYVKVTSWLEATVDMTLFGLGNVYLVDASDAALREFRAVGSKQGWDSTIATAKLLAAYVDHADDPSFPQRGAGWQKWQTWLDSAKAKAVSRLSKAVSAFSNYIDDEDETSPN